VLGCHELLYRENTNRLYRHLYQTEPGLIVQISVLTIRPNLGTNIRTNIENESTYIEAMK
jgi:hypothetical protein